MMYLLNMVISTAMLHYRRVPTEDFLSLGKELQGVGNSSVAVLSLHQGCPLF